jgi:hypothetical protein
LHGINGTADGWCMPWCPQLSRPENSPWSLVLPLKFSKTWFHYIIIFHFLIQFPSFPIMYLCFTYYSHHFPRDVYKYNKITYTHIYIWFIHLCVCIIYIYTYKTYPYIYIYITYIHVYTYIYTLHLYNTYVCIIHIYIIHTYIYIVQYIYTHFFKKKQQYKHNIYIYI